MFSSSTLNLEDFSYFTKYTYNNQEDTIINNNKQNKKNQIFANEYLLRYKEIRLINSKGEQAGITSGYNALKKAREEDLDLVMIAKDDFLPVCKIMDLGKYKYDESKREREINKHKPLDMKEVKISPNIAEHDFIMMAKRAMDFLNIGHKVKISCLFKAREIVHPEVGAKKMVNMIDYLADCSLLEKTPMLEGKVMGMILIPKKK